MAYQGAGRGLGADDVRAVSLFASDGLLPARTLLLAGPRRLDGEHDRIEAEGDSFAGLVERGFADLAAREPARVVLIDASGTPDAVAARVWEATVA